MVSQATVDSLPVLVRDGIRLREVHLSDAAALTALFQMPDVSEHLDPPPATIADFGSWIALSQSRRAEGRAACYTLLTGNEEVTGLFMALRFEDHDRAEIGFAIAPQLWGTGVFQKIDRRLPGFPVQRVGRQDADRQDAGHATCARWARCGRSARR